MTSLSLPYTWPLDLAYSCSSGPERLCHFLPCSPSISPALTLESSSTRTQQFCLPASLPLCVLGRARPRPAAVPPSSPSSLHGTCSGGEPWGGPGWRDASTPVPSCYHPLVVLCLWDPSAPVKVFSNFPLLYCQIQLSSPGPFARGLWPQSGFLALVHITALQQALLGRPQPTRAFFLT